MKMDTARREAKRGRRFNITSMTLIGRVEEDDDEDFDLYEFDEDESDSNDDGVDGYDEIIETILKSGIGNAAGHDEVGNAKGDNVNNTHSLDFLKTNSISLG